MVDHRPPVFASFSQEQLGLVTTTPEAFPHDRLARNHRATGASRRPPNRRTLETCNERFHLLRTEQIEKILGRAAGGKSPHLHVVDIADRLLRADLPKQQVRETGLVLEFEKVEPDGRLRSASMNNTFRPDCAADPAINSAMVVLPSPGTVDVTCTTLGGLSTSVICRPLLIARMDSLKRDSGFKAG